VVVEIAKKIIFIFIFIFIFGKTKQKVRLLFSLCSQAKRHSYQNAGQRKAAAQAFFFVHGWNRFADHLFCFKLKLCFAKALQNWVVVVGVKEISQEFVSSLDTSKSSFGVQYGKKIWEVHLSLRRLSEEEWPVYVSGVTRN
jgi:hypothetical protein